MTEPQSAYAEFFSGFKSKLTYLIHTIPNISELILLLEHTIEQKFIPAIQVIKTFVTILPKTENRMFISSFCNKLFADLDIYQPFQFFLFFHNKNNMQGLCIKIRKQKSLRKRT